MKSDDITLIKSLSNGSTLHFSTKRFLISTLLFMQLAFIGLFIRDAFIRPFLGDVLVVIWLYYLIGSVLKISSIKLTLVVVIFAFTVEASQYFEVLKLFNLNAYCVLRIVLGATFDRMDLLAYLIGGLFCLALGHWHSSNR